MCHLNDLQVSSRAQGGGGDVLATIRLRNPGNPCRIATRADVALTDAAGHHRPARIIRSEHGRSSGLLRLGGGGSNSTAVVSLVWKEWCGPPPGQTMVTLRIPRAGGITRQPVFDGSPACLFEGREESTLTVSDVAVRVLTKQELG
jgi:hypothetical protein